MMEAKPKIICGVFPFEGAGLGAPKPLGSLSYKVPADKRSQFIYFRGGNSSAELVCVSVTCDGKPFRLFPIGAKAAVHVPLAVVEDLNPTPSSRC